MAWIVAESRPLNSEEMRNNAQEQANYMINFGFTANAISAILGNEQSESTINPGRWQSDIVGNMSGGFGLVQWTPATNIINWLTARGLPRTDGNGQCLWLATESGNGQWIPSGSYPLSWDEFKNSKQSPEYLARAFLYNFERPADPAATAAARARQALNWFNTLDWSGAG